MVDFTKDSKTIGCTRVFRKKDNEQYKAMLVAKRYAQKEGIDYNEIFSPVVNIHLFGCYLAMIVQFDLELKQMNVKQYFCTVR